MEVSKSFFTNQPERAELALKMIKNPEEFFIDSSEGYSRKIGRIIKAYEHIGMKNFANRISSLADSFKVKPVYENPFDTQYQSIIKLNTIANPAALRVEQKWDLYVKQIKENFNLFSIPITKDLSVLVENIKNDFLRDAYNSLSIEGYKITPEIIEAMKTDQGYKNNKDALAAKGYRMTFDCNLQSIKDNFLNNDFDYLDFCSQIKQNMFIPLVQAQILKIKEIIGYRDHQVYIKNAIHVPVSTNSVSDCMEKLGELLRRDENPFVKAVVGHLLFVYIHPYPDGNGRTARFLMNNILSRNGHSWVVTPNERRAEFFNNLEKASSGNDIIPFARFIYDLLNPTINLDNKDGFDNSRKNRI